MIRCYRCEAWPCVCADGICIVHGDCREVLPLLPPGTIDLVVTSPPYNQADKIDRGRKATARWHQMGVTSDWYADSVLFDEYAQNQALILDLMADVLVADGSIIYNHKPDHVDRRVNHPIDWIRRATRCALVEEIIWHTTTMMAFNAGLFVPNHEVLYWLCRADSKPRWPTREAMMWGSVWRMNVDREAPDHPCAFPRELPKRCIQALAGGGTVLDPFMGSGTTLVAALSLGRKAIGIEIEEKYCRIAVERLRQRPLPLIWTGSHDIIKTKQGVLIDGIASANVRGNQAEDFNSKQRTAAHSGGTTEAQRNTEAALS